MFNKSPDTNPYNNSNRWWQTYSDSINYNNECAIDGFCSIDPIVYSLMEILLYELKQITYYYVKMQELGYENKDLKNQTINYLSIILIGYEFDRSEFQDILEKIHNEKESVKESFIAVCEKRNMDCQI